MADAAGPARSVSEVDDFDCFATLCKVFRRTAAIALLVGVVAFPTQTSSLVMYAVSQKAASLTKLLQHALEPAMKAAEPRPPRTR